MGGGLGGRQGCHSGRGRGLWLVAGGSWLTAGSSWTDCWRVAGVSQSYSSFGICLNSKSFSFAFPALQSATSVRDLVSFFLNSNTPCDDRHVEMCMPSPKPPCKFSLFNSNSPYDDRQVEICMPSPKPPWPSEVVELRVFGLGLSVLTAPHLQGRLKCAPLLSKLSRDVWGRVFIGVLLKGRSLEIFWGDWGFVGWYLWRWLWGRRLGRWLLRGVWSVLG